MKPIFTTDNLEVFEIVFESSKFPASKKVVMAMESTVDQPLHAFCACEVEVSPDDGLHEVTVFFYPGPVRECSDEDDELSREIRMEYIGLVHEFLLVLRDHIGPYALSEYGLLPDDVVPSELVERLMLSSIDDTWNQLLANELSAGHLVRRQGRGRRG
jgi:hypothetical protein